MTKPKSKHRKVDCDSESGNDNSGEVKKLDVGSVNLNCQNQTTVGAPSATKSVSWFLSEIQSMMHGFGDCKKPLVESARLIEQIVYEQMTCLLMHASELASRRNSKFIGLEELLFLLRKDRVKLSRLINYIYIKDMKRWASSGAADVDENAETVYDAKVRKSGKQLCYDFLSSIDQTGELLSVLECDIHDVIKSERNVRAELQSRYMDGEQYKAFCQARRSSFGRKCQSNKFSDWLLRSYANEPKPNSLAMEIFLYFAYETVAQIVDLSLLVKREKITGDDPLDKVMTPYVLNTDYPQVKLSQASTTGSSQAASHPELANTLLRSPPPSPCSQNKCLQTSAKKRKKSGLSMLEFPQSQVILPTDIREAINRYLSPTGPFSYFSKSQPCVAFRPLLCT